MYIDGCSHHKLWFLHSLYMYTSFIDYRSGLLLSMNTVSLNDCLHEGRGVGTCHNPCTKNGELLTINLLFKLHFIALHNN